jgi:hypothetical protein
MRYVIIEGCEGEGGGFNRYILIYDMKHIILQYNLYNSKPKDLKVIYERVPAYKKD